MIDIIIQYFVDQSYQVVRSTKTEHEMTSVCMLDYPPNSIMYDEPERLLFRPQ